MSFPRAKRFNYKDPDIDISPADFNISRSLNKGCHFQKGPRFSEKQTNSDDWTNLACSRWNCCREAHLECSNPHKRRERCNASDINRRVMDFMRSDSMRASSTRDKAGKKAADGKHFQNAVSKSAEKENVSFTYSETFIDDDYDSFTGSEELSGGCLKKFEKHPDKVSQKKLERRFENHVLRKFRELEKRLENLRTMMNRLIDIRHTEQLDKQQKREMKKLDNARSLCDISQNSEFQRYYYAIKEMIKKAIAKLLNDFDMKVKPVHQDCNERKLLQLISEIWASNNSSAEKKTEELCEKVASDLTEKIMDMLNDHLSVPALDSNISGTSKKIAKGIKGVYQMNHDCFNYENICKVLSDQLQKSKDELLALKQDTIDITIKCKGTQKVLEEHVPIFMKLRDEIAAIKRDFTDDN